MALTTCELKWLQKLLLDLGVNHLALVRLYYDSQASFAY